MAPQINFDKVPVNYGNILIYRWYKLRKGEDPKKIESEIEVYSKKFNQPWFDRWDRLMDVIDEIEKDASVAAVTVSKIGATVRFNNHSDTDIYVKTTGNISKKKACWLTIIAYLIQKQKVIQ